MTWQRWALRVSFNYREGVVLHDVTYADPDRSIPRPVVHRMSVAEVCAPFAEPRQPFARKCSLNVGEYGLGNCASSLQLGVDSIGQVHYFDAVLCDR